MNDRHRQEESNSEQQIITERTSEPGTWEGGSGGRVQEEGERHHQSNETELVLALDLPKSRVKEKKTCKPPNARSPRSGLSQQVLKY